MVAPKRQRPHRAADDPFLYAFGLNLANQFEPSPFGRLNRARLSSPRSSLQMTSADFQSVSARCAALLRDDANFGLQCQAVPAIFSTASISAITAAGSGPFSSAPRLSSTCSGRVKPGTGKAIADLARIQPSAP